MQCSAQQRLACYTVYNTCEHHNSCSFLVGVASETPIGHTHNYSDSVTELECDQHSNEQEAPPWRSYVSSQQSVQRAARLMAYEERQEDEVEFLLAVFPGDLADLRARDPWKVGLDRAVCVWGGEGGDSVVGCARCIV